VQNINFSVYVTEGRPDGTGQTMARELDKLGVPVTMVLDSGVAYALER
jgi:translation initiation factor eIF-2B subunit alpha